jgi:hypothetical protein
MAESDHGERRPLSRRLVVLALEVLAVALIAIAALVVLRPFGIEVDLSHGSTAGATPLLVHGSCDAAARTAWNHEPKDGLKLWAVTVGTNMMGYTPVFGKDVKYVLLGSRNMRFPGSFCGGEARHRLIVSGAILTTGIIAVVSAVVLIRRRGRGAPSGVAT